MLNIYEEILELKIIQDDFLTLIAKAELQVPHSSDELYEQCQELKRYQSAITSIEHQLDELYFRLGSNKLFEEMLTASQESSEALSATAKKHILDFRAYSRDKSK